MLRNAPPLSLTQLSYTLIHTQVLLNIGVEPSVIALPEKINFADLCVFIDGKLPDPDPSLECSLFTFTRMVGEPDEEGRSDRIIRPKAICDFMTSLDRPAPTIR